MREFSWMTTGKWNSGIRTLGQEATVRVICDHGQYLAAMWRIESESERLDGEA
jgi:hypothetical protein